MTGMDVAISEKGLVVNIFFASSVYRSVCVPVDGRAPRLLATPWAGRANKGSESLSRAWTSPLGCRRRRRRRTVAGRTWIQRPQLPNQYRRRFPRDRDPAARTGRMRSRPACLTDFSLRPIPRTRPGPFRNTQAACGERPPACPRNRIAPTPGPAPGRRLSSQGRGTCAARWPQGPAAASRGIGRSLIGRFNKAAITLRPMAIIQTLS